MEKHLLRIIMVCCFNPCFNGTYSLTEIELHRQKIHFQCFNPCFNGTYSLTNTKKFEEISSQLF